jgi:hypothetical protein
MTLPLENGERIISYSICFGNYLIKSLRFFKEKISLAFPKQTGYTKGKTGGIL